MSTLDAAEVRRIQEADLAALRCLPALLLREGYVDGHGALAELQARDAPAALAALPPAVQTLLALFSLGREVERAALAEVLGEEERAALLRLGVLLEREGRCHTAGLLLVPLGGMLLFVPHPGGGAACFSDDTLDLAARLTPPRGARCLDLFAGPGALSLRLATLTDAVLAVEANPVALACAELSLAMNDLADRVELRHGELDDCLAPEERFDFIAALPPVLPFPPELALPSPGGIGDDGLLLLRRTLAALPRLLRPKGLAQLVVAAPGDAEGPRLRAELARAAEEGGLQVAMTVTARVRMRPGDGLFERMAQRCAGLGGLLPEEARRRLLQHLGTARVDHLYRCFLSVARGGRRPGLQVASYC